MKTTLPLRLRLERPLTSHPLTSHPLTSHPITDRPNLKQDRGDVVAIFEKGNDRWGHRILFDVGGRGELLCSIEGNDQQTWPPSPPLQNLDQQELSANHQAVLGVGGAGRSHWSASFSTEAPSAVQLSEWKEFLQNLQTAGPATSANFSGITSEPELHFLLVEIACLVKGAPDPKEVCLRSSYQIGEDFRVERCSVSPDQLSSMEHPSSILAIHCEGQLRALIVATDNSSADIDDRRIVIAPNEIQVRSLKSVCWSYRIVVF